ncbi:hypothetical protein llap_15345 [Limosa lapponica baueri]|uniref:Uncharacterized protein n=1 Tax=Limosa lapponica baueri TaxID=1758121 RepID=A0A2I0TKK8_LIMLA|nr:hypothetical protein llap_15345 [Limosa lapponica baueri]
MEDPIQLKEEGNKYFQASDYEKALQSYTQAIKLNKDKGLQAVLYRNRAACFLKKATAILHYLGIDNICMWMSVDSEEISLAVCNLLQTITDCLLGQGAEEHHGKEEAVVLDTKKDLRMITMRLLDMLVSKKVSGQGRDRALNLLNKNIPRKDLKDHDNSRTIFVIDNGLKKILKVVGQIPEMPDCLPLTENTQLTASVLLNKLYDDLRCDPERDNYRVICEEYIKWLCNTSIDARTRKWAVEGLAYLTLDADVKDDFVEDEPALQAMFELAKTSDKTILYSVASALVNCTNSYDTKELVPELVQLAKFSKQHVPEEHPKDKKDFVVKRVKRLLKAGVVSALACMVKADSAILTDQSKELIARVFLALCEDPKDRGTIVAQGGGKALIPLAVEGTEVGKIKASHALAKIAAISNPDIAFPGERVYEVVRPLVSLLNTERDGLQNYEALLGLTNFSGRSDKLRLKIVKEKALPDIENYMFENHDQLRQAATECMCNLVVNKEVQERFVADGNDRLKLVVLLCGEDDEKVQVAAAGALAMLTAAQKKLCSKMTEVLIMTKAPRPSSKSHGCVGNVPLAVGRKLNCAEICCATIYGSWYFWNS